MSNGETRQMNLNSIFHRGKDATIIVSLVYIFTQILPILKEYSKIENGLHAITVVQEKIEKTNERVADIEKAQARYNAQTGELIRRMESIESKIDKIFDRIIFKSNGR